MKLNDMYFVVDVGGSRYRRGQVVEMVEGMYGMHLVRFEHPACDVTLPLELVHFDDSACDCEECCERGQNHWMFFKTAEERNAWLIWVETDDEVADDAGPVVRLADRQRSSKAPRKPTT